MTGLTPTPGVANIAVQLPTDAPYFIAADGMISFHHFPKERDIREAQRKLVVAVTEFFLTIREDAAETTEISREMERARLASGRS